MAFLTDDLFHCSRCGKDISACGRSPGDGYVYCSSECETAGPKLEVPQCEGQLEMFGGAS